MSPAVDGVVMPAASWRPRSMTLRAGSRLIWLPHSAALGGYST